MKRYLKTILCSAIFSFVIALPISGIAASAAEEYDSPAVQLGLADSSLAKSDRVLTRGEYCVLVTDIMTWNGTDAVPSATRQVFADVEQWDWLSDDLEYLYDRNIIFGYDDGTFRPNEPIELASAYNMLLRLLGYDAYIRANGDYPEAVIRTAARSGLSDGVSGAYDTPVTGKMAVKMFDNLLDTRVMEVDEVAVGSMSFKTGDIFLNDYFDIYERKGVVTGVEGISFTGSGAAAGYIKIDGETYVNTAVDSERLLGYEVSYYIVMKDGTEGSIVALVPKKTNSAFDIESRDIISYENRMIKYWEGAKEKRADVSGAADIIINGVAKTANDVFVPDYGVIRLVDNDGDRKYDVVMISDYDTVIVETVDRSKGIIYGQNNDKNGNRYAIDVNKYGYVGLFNSDGKRIELKDIAAGSVITAEISDGDYLRMYCSESSVTGEIEYIGNDGETRKLTIDGTQYYTVYNMYIKIGTLSVGAAGSFPVDFKGNIAAAIFDKTGTWSFGYMMRAYIDDGDETVTLKLLTSDGSIEHIRCASDLKIDSAQAANPAYAADVLAKPQLIRYRMKKDDIGMIDLAQDQPMSDFSYTVTDTNNALLRRANGPMQWKPNVNTFKSRGWNASITNIPQEEYVSGEARLTSNTVIFQLPSNPENADDSDYSVIKMSALASNRQCDAALYTTDTNSLVAEAAVLSDEDMVINESPRLFVVEKALETVGADDEITYELIGWYNGARATRTLKRADMIKVGTHKLTRGDIIRTRQNSAGVTTNIEMIYSADGTAGYLVTSSVWCPVTVGTTSFDSLMRCFIGEVRKKSETSVVVGYTGRTGTAYNEIFDLTPTAIYVVDLNKTSKSDPIYIGTSGDIREGDTVIMSTRASTPTELIVYR